jgi:hypothetical protein
MFCLTILRMIGKGGELRNGERVVGHTLVCRMREKVEMSLIKERFVMG